MIDGGEVAIGRLRLIAFFSHREKTDTQPSVQLNATSTKARHAAVR
jgi:hypothetical protein